MVKLVFARHGESEWNKANLFTGWADVDLSEKGTQQAIDAGKLIKEAGIEFDQAYTSVLKRAIKTTNLALEASDQLWVPVEKSWRLNERHYGGLTGKNKAEAAEQFGDEQVHIWRRSYDVLPPNMDRDDEHSAHTDRRYASLDDSVIPDAENLKVTLERALPFWEDKIAPALKDGKNVFVGAHGNSIRALVKHIKGLSDDEIILAVAANTGFSAFPMLAYNMAKNKYMPHLFMEKGDRLGYSNGILTLAFGAMILLLIFNGNTERLIPLYTIGVFVPFALSQTGMIRHWKKEKGANFLKPAFANILGAIICYAIVLILLLFRLGDIWPFFPIILVLTFLFLSIHSHYQKVAKQLRLFEGIEKRTYDGNLVHMNHIQVSMME